MILQVMVNVVAGVKPAQSKKLIDLLVREKKGKKLYKPKRDEKEDYANFFFFLCV